MKPRILVADKLHGDAVKELKKFAEVDTDFEITPEDLVKNIHAYDGIVVRSRSKVTKDVIEAGKKLKVIARAGVGLDNVDVEAAKAKGIQVYNAPESLTISVAELAIALMLDISRKISYADRKMRHGSWEKKACVGMELYGKTLGLVGFGRIGREVAMRARAMGMRILASDPAITIEDVREFNAELVDLDELFKHSDVISLHIPANEKTKGFMNKERIAKMKKTAVLINTARGAVVDEKALIEALKTGAIKGAALDVYEKEPLEASELTSLDNVVLTPHIGSGTDDAQRTAGMIVAEKIRALYGA
ncbi:MAG: hydroxyacid dehydrogenase [Candidatus Altiarchaeota archaeon]|nr:hydroxyacid dehydrogenase [Candidatus Altiarchaeota archaeon]